MVIFPFGKKKEVPGLINKSDYFLGIREYWKWIKQKTRTFSPPRKKKRQGGESLLFTRSPKIARLCLGDLALDLVEAATLPHELYKLLARPENKMGVSLFEGTRFFLVSGSRGNQQENH